MNEHLSRRVKRIEGLSDLNPDKKTKIVVINYDETLEEAFAREGLDPNEPNAGLLVIRLERQGGPRNGCNSDTLLRP